METNLTRAYGDAYKIAIEELSKKDINQICLNADVSVNRFEEVFFVKYLNIVYQVNYKTGYIHRIDCNEEVPVTTKILILHYLLNASNRALSGNLVSFKDLKSGGAIYYNAFFKRAISPLIKAFGSCVQDIHPAAAHLCGFKDRYGHASATISAFPRVPVTFVLWEGEEDIPASATILFDDSIESYLPAEDIAFLSSLCVYELIRLKYTISVKD